MEKIIDSPFTDGKAVLNKKLKKMSFRKEEFEVFDLFYKCENTGEEFSTSETGDITLKQLYNQYREKNNILFPEQIIELRRKYGLSSLKMSSVLGFGPNIYKSYEKGDIPNKSNSTLLNIAKDPKQFYEIAVNSKQLNPTELEKLKELADKLIKEELNFELEQYLRINSDEISQFTGYVKRNFEKFANMVLFFIEDERTFTTRLNKYLFYSDFICYSNTGFSMSGYPYTAIENGPVPDDYKSLFYKLWETDIIQTKEVVFDDKTFEQFVPAKKFDKKMFDQAEIKILNNVYEELRFKKTKDIIDQSHKEKGWIENEEKKDDISFQKYAFELNVF
jgi:putative zinc finger/helix-turn-helix YgiT family protein